MPGILQTGPGKDCETKLRLVSLSIASKLPASSGHCGRIANDKRDLAVHVYVLTLEETHEEGLTPDSLTLLLAPHPAPKA